MLFILKITSIRFITILIYWQTVISVPLNYILRKHFCKGSFQVLNHTIKLTIGVIKEHFSQYLVN